MVDVCFLEDAANFMAVQNSGETIAPANPASGGGGGGTLWAGGRGDKLNQHLHPPATKPVRRTSSY